MVAETTDRTLSLQNLESSLNNLRYTVHWNSCFGRSANLQEACTVFVSPCFINVKQSILSRSFSWLMVVFLLFLSLLSRTFKNIQGRSFRAAPKRSACNSANSSRAPLCVVVKSTNQRASCGVNECHRRCSAGWLERAAVSCNKEAVAPSTQHLDRCWNNKQHFPPSREARSDSWLLEDFPEEKCRLKTSGVSARWVFVFVCLHWVNCPHDWEHWVQCRRWACYF